MEAHLLVCEPCREEMDFMRLMVGGLRGLPAASPPSSFVASVLARWKTEREEPMSPDLVAEPVAPAPVQIQPSTLPVAPVAHPPAVAPVVLTRPGAWGLPSPTAAPPPHARPRPYAIKPFYGLVAAMFAVIFVVGMFTGKSYYGPGAVKTAGIVPNVRDVADQLKQALDLRVGTADASAPPSASGASECAGRANEWNPTHLQVMVRPPLQHEDLAQAEVAVWVPNYVRVSFDRNEYTSGQLLLIPVRVAENGQWQGSLRWRALRAGRFDAWVETRWAGGLYQHRPIVFNATSP